MVELKVVIESTNVEFCVDVDGVEFDDLDCSALISNVRVVLLKIASEVFNDLEMSVTVDGVAIKLEIETTILEFVAVDCWVPDAEVDKSDVLESQG